MMRHRVLLAAAVSLGLVGCTVRPGSLVSLPVGTSGAMAPSTAQPAPVTEPVTSPVSEYGTLTLTVRWPERPAGYQTALIPTSTNTLVIKVSSGSTEVASTTVTREAGASTATANLSLKAGNNLSVEVLAYREAAPVPESAEPIARGTANVNITRSRKTTAGVSLAPLIVPTITSLSTNTGVPGDTVTITGTNFATDGTPVQVYFNGYVTGAVPTSSTSVTVTVPPGTPTGKVVVTSDGVSSESNMVFWVPKTVSLSVSKDFWDHSSADKLIVILGKQKQLFTSVTWETKTGDNIGYYGAPPSPSWSSSDAGSGTIDADGLFTAGNAYVPDGTIVTASYGSKTSDQLTIIPQAVSLALVPPTGPNILGGKGRPFLQYRAVNTFSDGATNSFVTYLPDASASVDVTGRATAADFSSNGQIAITAVSQVDDAQSRMATASLANFSVRTFAGTGQVGTATGSVSTARFNRPFGMALSRSGTLYVADTDNGRILTINNGTVDVLTFAGGAISRPHGLALHRDAGTGAETLYVSDQTFHRVYQIDLANRTRTLLAGGVGADLIDGPGQDARFNGPSGIVVDAEKNVYVADQGNHAIRKIDATGYVRTIAGSISGIDGHADANVGINARFKFPTGIALDRNGNLFVTQINDGKIRRITPSSQVSTLSLSRNFWNPYGIAVDGNGVLFVAENDTNYISKVGPGGDVTVIAGSPGNNLSPNIVDGIGTAASLRAPNYVILDEAGGLFVSEYTNNIIRKLE